MSDLVEIDWPWQYNFPPFFTLQPHADTRSKQVTAWKHLILDYCQKNKLYIVDAREAGQMPLFHNAAINRKLDAAVIVSILSELMRTGNAAAIDKAQHRWAIYWHTLEEWAQIIYGFVCERGRQNDVLTLFELAQGDDVQDREFYGINTEVLISVLKVLERERKCELILSDEDQGVKFF